MPGNTPAGPRPARARVPAVPDRRAQLLAELRRRGPSTTGELAAATGLHPNTTREHLRVLVDEGQVDARPGAPEGRGRPSTRYRAVREAPDEALVVRQAGVLVAQAALARALLDGYGVPAADAAESARRHGLRASADLTVPDLPGLPDLPDPADGVPVPDPGGPSVASRQVEALAGHLDRMGFEPDLAGVADDGEVLLRACPFLDLARDRPDVVCSVHLGLAQGVLARAGGPVRATAVRPFAGPGYCVLALTGVTPRG